MGASWELSALIQQGQNEPYCALFLLSTVVIGPNPCHGCVPHCSFLHPEPALPLCLQEVSQEDYHKFYKAVSKDYQDPLGWTHFKAEGDVEFKCVLSS